MPSQVYACSKTPGIPPDHVAGVCLALAKHQHHRVDVCACKVVLLDYRSNQAGVLPFSTFVCHRESQANRTRPCVLTHLDWLLHKIDCYYQMCS